MGPMFWETWVVHQKISGCLGCALRMKGKAAICVIGRTVAASRYGTSEWVGFGRSRR